MAHRELNVSARSKLNLMPGQLAVALSSTFLSDPSRVSPLCARSGLRRLRVSFLFEGDCEGFFSSASPDMAGFTNNIQLPAFILGRMYRRGKSH